MKNWKVANKSSTKLQSYLSSYARVLNVSLEAHSVAAWADVFPLVSDLDVAARPTPETFIAGALCASGVVRVRSGGVRVLDLHALRR